MAFCPESVFHQPCQLLLLSICSRSCNPRLLQIDTRHLTVPHFSLNRLHLWLCYDLDQQQISRPTSSSSDDDIASAHLFSSCSSSFGLERMPWSCWYPFGLSSGGVWYSDPRLLHPSLHYPRKREEPLSGQFWCSLLHPSLRFGSPLEVAYRWQ